LLRSRERKHHGGAERHQNLYLRVFLANFVPMIAQSFLPE